MKLLAIETSCHQGSIALHDGRAVLASQTFSHGLQNAAKVLPLIEELCRGLEITPQGLTHVAVSVGPGSFTGLRIGVTLAKTLCFATGARLLAVPTLPVIASNAIGQAPYILPILDAKRDQVFAALYKAADHALDEIAAPRLCSLGEMLQAVHRPLLILGEGLKVHAHHIESQAADVKSEIRLAPEELWVPRASTVAALALRLVEKQAFADPFTLTPLYIRKPEAQERMEAGLLKHLEQ
jgi:tRNA threonylcarbamoyladenosine biosynthesis protein TsaB